MIKCNLAVLLAERGLKMADLINDTGLSKTAVRGLYYNTSKGIQFDTLETICDYLHVEPGDVIKKIDFRYRILDKKIDNNSGIIDFFIEFTYDTKKHLEVVTVAVLVPEFPELIKEEYSSCEMYLGLYYNDEAKQNVFAQITEAETEKLKNYLVNDFIATFKLEQHHLKETLINETTIHLYGTKFDIKLNNRN